jgi:hypothetical protein
MIGKKIKLEKDFLEKNMGYSYRELDSIGNVYAIVLDKYIGVNKYDKYEGQSHSYDYVYLTTEYYLIKILRCDYDDLNRKLNYLGNVWTIKPYQIKNIID